MIYWHTARETFGPHTGDGWIKYTVEEDMTHLRELVSLDTILNRPVFDIDYTSDKKAHDYTVIEEKVITDFFNDLNFVIEKTKSLSEYNLLTVVKEPELACEDVHLSDFDFLGYDLIDNSWNGISALSNCGGFDETFLPKDLNEYGLITKYDLAYEIRGRLYDNNPDEDHADCIVMAIWRHKIIGRQKL